MTEQKHPSSAIYAGLDKTDELAPADQGAASSPEEEPSTAKPSGSVQTPPPATGAAGHENGGKGAKIAIAVIAVV